MYAVLLAHDTLADWPADYLMHASLGEAEAHLSAIEKAQPGTQGALMVKHTTGQWRSSSGRYTFEEQWALLTGGES